MKTEMKLATKRRHSEDIHLLNDSDLNMGDQHNPMKQTGENITSDATSKVVAVELNKRMKAKENEQDPLPSDDEEDLPDFNLTPEKIAAQRKKLAEKKALMEMEKQKKNS